MALWACTSGTSPHRPGSSHLVAPRSISRTYDASPYAKADHVAPRSGHFTDKTGPRLAIVGSTVLADSVPAVRLVVLDAIARWRPVVVISGGARGVDTIAAEVARELALGLVVFPAEGIGWQWYRQRNWLIAEACTALLRIVSARSRTYGSGWTRDRAVELGKPTEEVRLP